MPHANISTPLRINPEISIVLERVIVSDTPARRTKIPAVTAGNHYQNP
jgi:hypothetical protein